MAGPGLAGVIIRPGGLYGPGEGHWLHWHGEERLGFGPPHKTLPLIHDDDAAMAVLPRLSILHHNRSTWL